MSDSPQRTIEEHAARIRRASQERAAREVARDGEARTRPLSPSEARRQAEQAHRYRDRHNIR